MRSSYVAWEVCGLPLEQVLPSAFATHDNSMSYVSDKTNRKWRCNLHRHFVQTCRLHFSNGLKFKQVPLPAC